ncbi:MAG: zinc ABC transporter substrate-binding protein [Bacteroidales bacterium]|nr:zinc ABC transporter substrate-binding protein [Bacteroidales bacterium]
MKRYLLLLLIALISACGSSKKEASGPVIAVSILPQQYLLKHIVDTLAEVQVLVPPGASPATWEATPSEMRALGDALIYYRIGHIGFEKAWIEDIMNLNPGLKIIDLSSTLKLRSIDSRHGDHSHTGIDPHTWMSAENMEIMARQIYGDMSMLFPEHKDMIRKNYAALLAEIKESGRYAREKLAAHKGKSFLIFHPSLGYFADAYGLEQIAIEYEGKEPSPAHLETIVKKAREKNIHTIFVQKEFDVRNAEIIADEIEAKIIIIDPLSEDWPGAMKQLVNSLNKSFNE